MTVLTGSPQPCRTTSSQHTTWLQTHWGRVSSPGAVLLPLWAAHLGQDVTNSTRGCAADAGYWPARGRRQRTLHTGKRHGLTPRCLLGAAVEGNGCKCFLILSAGTTASLGITERSDFHCSDLLWDPSSVSLRLCTKGSAKESSNHVAADSSHPGSCFLLYVPCSSRCLHEQQEPLLFQLCLLSFSLVFP